MKLIPASKLPEKKVLEFLKSAPQIKFRSLLQSGYVLEINHTIRGCFNLEKITGNIYELKQFYVTTTEDIEILQLFDMIIALAKKTGAKQIWVNSHKLMIDILLERLQFYPQTGQEQFKKHVKSSGKWWSYTIPD
jgi:N-acetylglutamate synthase-like GNAT family acetyltransferase